MAATEKIDLYKQHKDQYATPKKPVLVTMDEATYLTVSGRGAPGGPEFTEKIGALYGAAFTIKMTRKFAGQQDYAVCKLEGQWWADKEPEHFAQTPKDQWRWRLLIRTPDCVSADELTRAIAVLRERGKSESVQEVRLESLAEGLCVQMLHVGPYEREAETMAVMASFAEKNSLKLHGRHHEIYLSDPRRVPSNWLKTILRHPVAKMGD